MACFVSSSSRRLALKASQFAWLRSLQQQRAWFSSVEAPSLSQSQPLKNFNDLAKSLETSAASLTDFAMENETAIATTSAGQGLASDGEKAHMDRPNSKKKNKQKTNKAATAVGRPRTKHDEFVVQVKEPLTFQNQLDKFVSRNQLDDEEPYQAEGGSLSNTNVALKMSKAMEKAFVQHEEGRLQSTRNGRRMQDQDIDWETAMAFIRKAEEVSPTQMVDKVELQENTAVLNPTFTLAGVIDECPTLQRLVDLGVNLSKWESRNGNDSLETAALAMSLDFGKDIAPRLRFLVDHGVKPSNLGHLLTENPDLFKVQLDDMKVRVEYLTWRKFSVKSIAAILNSCPQWLNYSVADVDRRLGYFQRAFGLTGQQVRRLTLASPDLIVWDGVNMSVERVRHLLTNDLEFGEHDAKETLLRAPQVFMQWDEDSIRETHSVLRQMYTNQVLLHWPAILAVPAREVKTRHAFLRFLGKSQYDPKKPNYVSPKVISETTDQEFCAQVAKVPIDIFNKFLLTV